MGKNFIFGNIFGKSYEFTDIFPLNLEWGWLQHQKILTVLSGDL